MQTTVLKPERSSWNSRSWPRESSRVFVLSLSRFLFSFVCLSHWHVTRLQDLGSRSRGVSRTADEDAPVLLQTPLSRLSFLSSLALILARFLAFLRCSRSACLVLATAISRESTQNLLSTRVYFYNPSPRPLPRLMPLLAVSIPWWPPLWPCLSFPSTRTQLTMLLRPSI